MKPTSNKSIRQSPLHFVTTGSTRIPFFRTGAPSGKAVQAVHSFPPAYVHSGPRPSAYSGPNKPGLMPYIYIYIYMYKYCKTRAPCTSATLGRRENGREVLERRLVLVLLISLLFLFLFLFLLFIVLSIIMILLFYY